MRRKKKPRVSRSPIVEVCNAPQDLESRISRQGLCGFVLDSSIVTLASDCSPDMCEDSGHIGLVRAAWVSGETVMPVKTDLFVLGLAAACGGSLYAPMVGIVGYAMHYQIGPEGQWWSAPVQHWGIRYSFVLGAAACHRPAVRGPVHRSWPPPSTGGSQRGVLRIGSPQVPGRGLTGRIAFAGPCSDVVAVMTETDVALCYSPINNFERILFEAMACGVPVVVFDVGGVREVAVSEQNCLLVPDRDPSALAAAAQRLIAAPSSRERLTRGGRETVDRLFDAKKNADKVLVIHEELVAPRSQKRVLTDPKRSR